MTEAGATQYCSSCGTAMPLGTKYCPSCGKPTAAAPAGHASNLWYLLPIFLGIIGGLIMFFVLKDEDRRKAKKGLILGVILTAIGFVLYAVSLAAIGSIIASQQAADNFASTNADLSRTVGFCAEQVSGMVESAGIEVRQDIERQTVDSCDSIVTRISTEECGSGSPGYDVCRDGSIDRYFEVSQQYKAAG